MRGVASRALVALALVSSCWIAAGCTGDDGNPDGGGSGTVGCLKMEMLPVTCPTPPVTYSKVKPIFDARCISVCHNDRTPDPNMPGSTIWGFTDYDHVKTWSDTIRDTVGNCTMPPADAGVRVTLEERVAILEFIRCGLPQ